MRSCSWTSAAIVLYCLVSQAEFVKSGDTRILSSTKWKQIYNAVFSPRNIDYLDTTLIEWLEEMDASIEQVSDDSSISNEMKQRVRSWHEFTTNSSIENCNLDYLEKQHKKLVGSYKGEGDVALLFRVGQWNMFDLCLAKFGGSAESLYEAMGAQHRSSLLKLNKAYESWRLGVWTKKELAQEVMDLIGAKNKCSKKEIAATWKRSACGVLLNELSKGLFDRTGFEKMSALATYKGLSVAIRKVADPSLLPKAGDESPFLFNLYARHAKMCRKLDEMLPELAKHNSIGRVALKNIDGCFKANGGC